MPRPSFLPPLMVLGAVVIAAQAPGVLRIRARLVQADGTVTPVARHRLLISDNPATAPPREVVTGADGAADVRLPAGNYTVESDTPFVFGGRAYTWTRTLDVPGGGDTTLELTAANADVAAADVLPAATPRAAPTDAGAGILARWQDRVVEIWTPIAHASGFVVGGSGWVATDPRAVAGTTSVEVQFTPALKVAGTVVVSEPERDVAVIRIDPGALGPVTTLAPDCSTPPPPPGEGQQVFAIGTALRQPRSVWSGTLVHVGPYALETDLDLEPGTAGGPAFSADGALLGVTSVADGSDERPEYRVVRVTGLCAAIAFAETLAKNSPPPAASRLPVEPAHPFPAPGLEEAARRHAGRRDPYQASSSDFDVAFITPPLLYSARHQTRPTSLPVRTGRASEPTPEADERRQALMDFGRWSAYVTDDLPVLIVRVTPRLVEGFWTMVARGAARTQGVSLPPMKRFRSGFARLQAFCGEREVTPIHPFALERSVSATATIDEGLYVFDPDALTPECGSVRLVLYARTSPGKGETLVVDGALLRQIWQDFAPYRAGR